MILRSCEMSFGGVILHANFSSLAPSLLPTNCWQCQRKYIDSNAAVDGLLPARLMIWLLGWSVVATRNGSPKLLGSLFLTQSSPVRLASDPQLSLMQFAR